VAWFFTKIIMSSNEKPWEVAYLRAALEVDSQKMPGRIVAARDAVADRLQDLKGNPDHHSERHEIESALAALTNLDDEAKTWPTAAAQLRPKKEIEGAA
jgi:hypothetical protein